MPKTKSKIILLSLLLLIVAATQVFADTGKVHIKEGSIKLRSTKALVYWLDSSVTSYGFEGSVSNGVTKWDEATSAFTINQTDSSSADIKVFGGNKSLPANTFGSATYWKTNSIGEVSQVSSSDVTNGTDYVYARIVLDAGWQGDFGFNSSERYKTSAHEVGHVLGMNHFEEAPAHTGDHWMMSGQISLLSPTSVDLAHLRTKWGW